MLAISYELVGQRTIRGFTKIQIFLFIDDGVFRILPLGVLNADEYQHLQFACEITKQNNFNYYIYLFTILFTTLAKIPFN